MAIKTIPLSRLEADLKKTLNECADSGQTVIVESSRDMIHWTPVQTNIVTSATLSVTNFVNPDVPGEFFKISVP